MCWPCVDVLVFVYMDRPPDPVEEAIESVNPKEQGLPASNPQESFRSESHAPAELMKRKYKKGHM